MFPSMTEGDEVYLKLADETPMNSAQKQDIDILWNGKCEIEHSAFYSHS